MIELETTTVRENVHQYPPFVIRQLLSRNDSHVPQFHHVLAKPGLVDDELVMCHFDWAQSVT
jgi:hypothetical protein